MEELTVILGILLIILILPIVSVIKLCRVQNSVENLHRRLDLLIKQSSDDEAHNKSAVMPTVPAAAVAVHHIPEPEPATKPVIKSNQQEIPDNSPQPTEPFRITLPHAVKIAEPAISAAAKVEQPAVEAPVRTAEIEEQKMPEPVKTENPANNTTDRLGSMLERKADEINTKLDSLQERSELLIKKLWSWLCVGEEYRDKNVSGEYFVATTWLIRLGVLILLCGIGFFLKYSIDRNWTTPLVRVIMMAFAGSLLIAGGIWKSRSKYRQLAIALAGAGFVTLYLSIIAAYKLYDLLPALWAFALMTAVTAVAMLTALKLDAMATALIGCTGGFLTPVLINTGSRNITGLLIYFAILGAGTLLTARKKDWTVLNLASFLFYVMISIMPTCNYTVQTNALAVIALLAVNYLIYSFQLTTAANKRDLTFLEILMMIGNAGFYIALSVDLSKSFFSGTKISAAAVLLLALAAMLELWIAKYKYRAERPVLSTLLQLKFVFGVALTIPLLLNGIWVIAAWSLLALLIAEAGLRLRSQLLLVFSALLYTVTALREAVIPCAFAGTAGSYWQALYFHLMTAGVYIAALAFTGVRLLRAASKDCEHLPTIYPSSGKVFTALAGSLFFIYSSYELFSGMDTFHTNYASAALVVYWSILAISIGIIIRRYQQDKFVFVLLMLLILTGFRVLSLIDLGSNYLEGLLFTLASAGVYIAALLITAGELCKLAINCQAEKIQQQLKTAAATVYTVAGVLFFFYSSREVYEFFDWYQPDFADGGLSVYWSILAFISIVYGLKKQHKSLRLCGIILFLVTALKIFFIDLAELAQIWRIVAFIVIGAVIYIKCKDIFIDQSNDQQ